MNYPNQVCAEYIGDNYDLTGDTDPECIVCVDRSNCELMQAKETFWKDKIGKGSYQKSSNGQNQSTLL